MQSIGEETYTNTHFPNILKLRSNIALRMSSLPQENVVPCRKPAMVVPPQMSELTEELVQQLKDLAVTLNQKLAMKDRTIEQLKHQIMKNKQESIQKSSFCDCSFNNALKEKNLEIEQLCQELDHVHRKHRKEKLFLEDTIYCLERDIICCMRSTKKLAEYSV